MSFVGSGDIHARERNPDLCHVRDDRPRRWWRSAARPRGIVPTANGNGIDDGRQPQALAADRSQIGMAPGWSCLNDVALGSFVLDGLKSHPSSIRPSGNEPVYLRCILISDAKSCRQLRVLEDWSGGWYRKRTADVPRSERPSAAALQAIQKIQPARPMLNLRERCCRPNAIAPNDELAPVGLPRGTSDSDLRAKTPSYLRLSGPRGWGSRPPRRQGRNIPKSEVVAITGDGWFRSRAANSRPQCSFTSAWYAGVSKQCLWHMAGATARGVRRPAFFPRWSSDRVNPDFVQICGIPSRRTLRG